MKIHSSSLASIPARYKANNHNETQNPKAKKNEDSLQDRSAIELKHLQSPIQIKNTLKQADLLHIATPLQNFPVNSRSDQAINAYIQETNQPLKNHRSELITGIDIFV